MQSPLCSVFFHNNIQHVSILGLLIRLKTSTPLHVHAPFPHGPEKGGLYHALVTEQDIRVEHVDAAFRIMNLAAASLEGVVVAMGPDANVVDLVADPQQVVGETEHAERLDRFGLQAICTASGGPIRALVYDAGLDAETGKIVAAVLPSVPKRQIESMRVRVYTARCS